MKYVKQLTIILTLSFAGELLHALIPLPVPASIYGLLLMLSGLLTGIIRVESVRETADFLVDTMALMFIPAAVGLITAFDLLKKHLPAYVMLTFVSTVVVFFVSGRVTQFFLRKGKEDDKK
ncbi:MAG: CidA/LrgA family protein [Oscillospiraceae bacterium]|nr:CidA/LrgA family protein [Oscillospiraceae bacterium]MBR7150350.1 CidA/LrgA family protein [Oscillospiraceae bacterium]